nr:hypothetical protein [Deltaproteobacteria bacterium]
MEPRAASATASTTAMGPWRSPSAKCRGRSRPGSTAMREPWVERRASMRTRRKKVPVEGRSAMGRRGDGGCEGWRKVVAGGASVRAADRWTSCPSPPLLRNLE